MTSDAAGLEQDLAWQLIAASSEGLTAIDPQGRCLAWSPGMTRITGIPAGDAQGQPLRDLLPDLANGELSQAMAGTTVTRQDLDVTVPATRRRLWLDVRAAPLRRQERIAGAILVLCDVTERKRIAAQIQETEQRFMTMADASPVLLWMARSDSLCTFFNQTWLTFTGRTLEQEWGVGWAENIHPEDMQRSMDTYEAAFSARQTFAMEYRLRRADGEYRWLLDKGTPRYGPDGSFAGFIGSCVDISDLKQLELDLRKAVRTRDEFLSIASHELRTPLTALGLQTQSLQRALQRDAAVALNPETLGQRLAIVQQQTQRLETLIDALLDVSRMATGRLPLTLEPVDLAQVVREVVDGFADEAAQTGTTISLLAAGPVIGQWDRLRLEQLATNLVSNALKYGRGEPVEVTVGQDGTQARLQVRDHGIGIAAADQERIFRQFERAVSVDHYGGFGVGLWIASQIVQALHGHIAVESAPGAGACFTVSLVTRHEQ